MNEKIELEVEHKLNQANFYKLRLRFCAGFFKVPTNGTRREHEGTLE